MLRGRIVAVEGTPAAELTGPAKAPSWALRGDRGITYSDTLPANSTLVGRRHGGRAGYEGEPLVSLEEEIADGLGLTLGDTISVNVLGRNITARIANLRELDWESLSINFVMVFSPNTLPRRAARRTSRRCGCRRMRDATSERAVLSTVTNAFPGVTSISVRDAIDSVNALIADLALAVRVAASLALLVSMLVLGGALAAGHRQRRQDAVVLKTLGATRPVLLSAFSLEYGLLGIATALFALAAGHGRCLVRGEPGHGAGIHRLPERRRHRRRDGACGDARAGACRNLADSLGQARAAPQESLRRDN